jgi:hypothetical protein
MVRGSEQIPQKEAKLISLTDIHDSRYLSRLPIISRSMAFRNFTFLCIGPFKENKETFTRIFTYLRWLAKAMREKKHILFPQYNILFQQFIILFPQERYFVPTRKVFCSHNILFCSNNISYCSLNILLLILTNYPPQERPPIL